MAESNDVVRRVTEFAEGYLEEFGDSFTKVEDGVFYTKRGSTLVRIEVLPWGEKEALVRVGSEVVAGATLDPKLLTLLLRTNQDATFGAFGLDEDGTVTLHHALFGTTMDRDELVSAIYAVARAADDWDDKIIADFGGETAVDRLAKGKAKPEEGGDGGGS